VQPFRADWLDGVVSERWSEIGRRGALALVIGNTRALWPTVLDALLADAALLGDPHPIDRYTERSIAAALAAVSTDHAIRWAHQPPFVPIQRLAERAGLARLAPSRISTHPRFGPWIALRAVAVLDADGPLGPPPRLPSPCDACAHACEPALARALGAADDWRLWVAVRDSCPLGAEHRYSEEQIHYHYTKDVRVLRDAVRRRRNA
jgi:methylmalonic aciduria homocystinuria type C protein